MSQKKLLSRALILALAAGIYTCNAVEAETVIDIDNVTIDGCVYGNGTDGDYTIKPENNSAKEYKLNIFAGANIDKNIYAAYSEGKGDVLSNNTVNLKNASFVSNLQVLGAWSLAGKAVNNEVNIIDSVVPNEVIGGKVGNVKSGIVDGYYEITLPDNTELISKDNTVNMYGGKVGSIIGGSVKARDNGNGTTTANSSYNSVNIYDGDVESVGGGLINCNRSKVNGIISNNTVSIYGGNVGRVYAGSGSYDTYRSCIVKDNTVNWYGGHINGSIVGDSVHTWDPTSKSTFNFFASAENSNKMIDGIKNFKNYNFYIDNSVAPDTTLITVADTVDLRQSNICVAATADTQLKKGDQVTLLSSYEAVLTPENLHNNLNGYGNARAANIYNVYDFNLTNPDGKNLKAEIGKVSPTYQMESISASRQPEVAFLDDKLDIVDFAYQMSVNKPEPVIFIDFNYMDIKRDHWNLRGNDMVVGQAYTKKNEDTKNSITQGPFFEYGDNSYSGTNFYSTGDVDGSGKVKKYGAGYLFRQVKFGRHHFDAYVRAGKVTNDFKSNMAYLGEVDYDNSDMYYAAHLGYGQFLNIDPHTKLDVYSNYFYKTIPGSSTNTHVNGVDYATEFDALTSHKFRVGSKITWDYMKENDVC